MAELLNVRYVLSGSMQISDTHLRLSAELTEADVGHVVWADRFEGSMANIFELQDRLSIEVRYDKGTRTYDCVINVQDHTSQCQKT